MAHPPNRDEDNATTTRCRTLRAANVLGLTKTTCHDDILNCRTGIGVGDRCDKGNKGQEFGTISGLKKLGAGVARRG